MKALIIDNKNKKPKMVIDEVAMPEPADYDLLVKIEATALNRADLLQKKGKYPPPKGTPTITGLEMSGVVQDTGFQVTRFEPGDHVFGLLPGGGYAEYCTIHERMAMVLPGNYSFEQAAAIPETFLTAFQALKYLGDIKKNETVLIHAGASGVGTAAIQLATQLFKARVITTASRKKKLDACKNLGADLVINYKKKDFSTFIKEERGDNSVDLIIDFIGAPYWGKNIDILGMDGRLVYLSMLGGTDLKNVDLLPLLKYRLSIKGSTLRNRTDEYKMRLTSDFHSYAMELFESGDLKPVIDKIYDWNEVEEAHQRMEKNKNIGKIVLTGM